MGTYNSIPNDATRRRILNEEINPRQTPPGNATQTTNPITGRRYELGSHEDFFLPTAIEIFAHILASSPQGIKHERITTEFVEYQLTLARMDVAYGRRNEELSLEQYNQDRNAIYALLEVLHKNKIPLAIVSNPDGLNDVLTELETGKNTFRKLLDSTSLPFFNAYVMMSMRERPS